MGDVFTTATTLANQVTTAYEQYAYFALRDELYFDACASIKPVAQSHRGSTVQFNIYTDLAPKVSVLSETADVDAVAVSDSIVTVALNEYGNAAITTARVRGLSFLMVSEDVANIVGYNAGISFDSLARNVLVAGTNAYFGNGGAGPRNTLNATNLLKAADVRRRVANLSSANVQRIINGMYKGFFAPEVEVDFREETGAAAWRDPHTYSQPEQIWNGETGAFEGVSWIVTSRLTADSLETAQGGPGGFVNGGAGPRNTLNASNLFKAADARRRVANLSSANVQRIINGMYKGFMAPEVEVDFREETGAAAWRDPHTYSQPEQIWNGETGAFEGVSWIVSSRLTADALETAQGGPGGFVNGGAAGGGTGNFDVFPVLVLGNQALAKTWSNLVSGPMPNVILGEVTDKLRRFVPVGWYWLGGFGRFREQAIRRIEVTTSMVK